MKWLTRILLFASLFVATSAWSATERFAVVIGNNLGHEPHRALRFAEADARKFAQTLIEVGGFSKHRVKVLLGATASQAWTTIRQVAAQAKKTSTDPTTRTLLVVYYSGHADGDVLEMGSSSLRFEELSKFLKQPGIAVRLAFVDSCKSGSLVAMKGGRRGPAYDINVNEDIRSSGYAIVTSSTDDELSQEAKEIRGSFFSHYIVSGLRGAADESGDGRITLGEVYRYAYSRTVARTTSSIGGAQHPMYQFKLTGQGEIILSQPKRMTSFLAVSSGHKGRLLVLNQKGDAVVAERDLRARTKTRIALAPAEYTVYLLGKNSVGRTRIRLARGQGVHLTTDAFEGYEPHKTVAKGGLFKPNTRPWGHVLGAGFLLRMAAVKNKAVALGATTSYRLETSSGWLASARISWSTTPSNGAEGYSDLGIMAGLGHGWRIRSFLVHVDLFAGYEHLFQDEEGQDTRHSSGFAYSGQVGVSIPIQAFVATINGGLGGRVFQVTDDGWVHRLDLLLNLGVGWKWK